MHSIEALAADLRRLGVPQDGVLVVHSGYRALGGVEGGPRGVVEALRRAAGERVTLIAPTFTTNLVDPYTWPVPPPPEERERILSSMPVFDRDKSPPHKMGAIATALWQAEDAVRSHHPVTSWTAIGPRAQELTHEHPLGDPEGIDGPVGRAMRADALVLLLGVDNDANTTIHLAESILDMPHLYALPDRYPEVTEEGGRAWRPVLKTTKCSDGFLKLDGHLERAGVVRHGHVGDAECQLIRSRDIVRVATELLSRDPAALLCDDAECVHCPTSRQLLEGWQPRPGWQALIPA